MSKLVRSMVLVGLSLGAAATGAQAPDATVADPEGHQVVLENDHVRVIRAIAAHGYKSPMHSHLPLAVISLGTGRVRFTTPDGKKQILDVYPGMAFWGDNVQHSWELLAGEVNAVGVEVKAAKGAPAPAKPSGGAPAGAALDPRDATIADPDVHQVMLENDHVRIFRALAAHGYKSPMHSHPPRVIVSLGTGRLRLTLPDGKKQILDLSPGQVLWIGDAEHSWELLAGEVNVVVVEVKAAKAIETPPPSPSSGAATAAGVGAGALSG